MNYGMYMSASGALTNIARQDILANNLANMTTAAFKEDFAPIMERQAARIEDGLTGLPSNKMLEKLGAGALLAPVRTNFAPAALDTSSNPFDLGIEGPGFFVVDTGKGSGDQRMRLTRDGRLTLSAGGRLVRTADGLPVMGIGNLPINLDHNQPVEVLSDGTVRQGGGDVAAIKIVSPPDTKALHKDGNGLYSFAGDRMPTGGPRGMVRQSTVERSGVDPFEALMRITHAGTAVEENTRLLALHDQAIGRAVGTLGRVS